MAKRFFYVCAGILMLALSYHFGASTAGAQAPGNPIVAAFSQPSGGTKELWAYSLNGDVFVSEDSGLSFSHRANVFGGSGTGKGVAAAFPNPNTTNEQWVYAADGSEYLTEDAGATYTLRADVFAGPTPVQPTTFGAIKARFRR